MHPDYPVDIFTSCLTTPIQIALRWFVRNNRASMGDLDPDSVDRIPGQANDRKTPIGELNWIFTAVTDSIAWNVLPKPLFQRLFRQDLLVAGGSDSAQFELHTSIVSTDATWCGGSSAVVCLGLGL
jgi:regulator-associated protein of mTOR